jgi:methylglyoxal synthase
MPQKDVAELANVAILEIEDGCISGDSQIGHDAVHTTNVAILEIEDGCISGDSQIGHDAVHTNALKRYRRACKRSHS